MVPEFRKAFNTRFTEKRYKAFLADLSSAQKYPIDFRVSETPLFLSDALRNSLLNACEAVVSAIQSIKYSIPKGITVPNEDSHPAFLQLDFAICKDENGRYVPQLIELQGFPSLYCFQILLDEACRKHFALPSEFTPYFGGLDRTKYIDRLKKLIVHDEDPQQTVLLEIEPEKQKTRIDFACTESYLGIPTVSLSDFIVHGKKVFYKSQGKEVPVKRIYNRVIFDELTQKNIPTEFDFRNEYDIAWVGHPSWFFRISKYSLPFFTNKYSLPSFFLNELERYPHDLENYVLKPLFSFAGAGIEMNVTAQLLDSIKDKSAYILQRKIEYAPLIETPDGFSKAEIRMMYLWDERPLLVNNLVRMSKGMMMGVNFNKNKTWVGSSLAYHVSER